MLAIFACAHPVAAAVTERRAFDEDAYITLAQSFVHRGQLWVVGKQAIAPDYSKEQSAAYVVDVDRGLVEKFAIPEGVTELTPWQHGFMAVRPATGAPERGAVHVQRLDQNGHALAAEYVFDAYSYGDLHLQPGADGDLFVAESIGEGSVLRAVNSRGETTWERAIDRRIATTALTDRGLALLTEPASNGSSGPLMIMYSKAGDVVWRVSTPASSAWYRDLQFVAPDRLFVRHRTPANETRLAVTNTVDGSLVADVSVPSLYWMRPAEDGVLLSGHSLGAPHIVRIDRTGKTLWSRRFMVQTNYSELLQPATVVAGKLIVLGQSKSFDARGAETYSPPVMLVSEPTGEELARERGYCVQLDAARLERLQQTLREDHSMEVAVELLPRHAISATSRDCSYPTEQQLLSYHQQLLGLLGGSPTNPKPYLNLFRIQLGEPGSATRLVWYHWDRSIADAPEAAFGIATDLRAPQAVLRLVQEQLQPHTIRVRKYVDRFYELTRCAIAVEIDEPRSLSDPDRLLSAIEATFEQLLDTIASMPEGQRRAGLEGNPHVYTRLQPGLFGGRDAMSDVKNARQTLKMLFEQQRTQAGQQ